MSSWSEAIWVVKKLEKYFNFEDDIDNYRNQLNNIAIPEIMGLNNKVENLSDKITEKEKYLATLASSFISTETSPGSKIPSKTTIEPSKGTIWFVSK